MTFLPNIPQAADDPAVSQGQILTNFQQLETVFDVDHVPYTIGVGAGAGYHDRVVFNSVAAPPALGPRSTLHTALIAGFAELFFQNGNNVDKQLTGLTIVTVGTNYGVTTPWGLVLNWGVCNANGVGIVNTFAIPFPTNCLAVVATGGNAAQPTNVIKVTTVLPASFVGRAPSGEAGFYIAIGK
jgi:hypothetical protein